MKKMRLFLIAAALALAAACSKEEGLDVSQSLLNKEVQFTDAELQALYQMRGSDNKVSIEEAMSFANDVIGFLDGEAALKSGTSRRIGSVAALRTDKAKTVALKSSDGTDIELPDTVAYVVNFADSAGFALIAGDVRIGTPILAYVGEGALGNEIDNPGLAIFLEGTEEYILRSITDFENQKDSIVNEVLMKMGVEDEAGTKIAKEPDYEIQVSPASKCTRCQRCYQQNDRNRNTKIFHNGDVDNNS